MIRAMEIKIVKNLQHAGINFWIRQFGNIFEYLIIHQGELYNNHLIIKPVWYRRFLKNPYTEEQFEKAVNLTIASAYSTINDLINKYGTQNKTPRSKTDK